MGAFEAMEPVAPGGPPAGGAARAFEIFDRLRERPEAEREPLLMAEALTDEERSWVRSLLAHDSPTGEFLGRPIDRATARLLRHFGDEEVPREIGSYRVVRELGRGGFGAVFLCEQARPRRLVAVKVMRSFFTQVERRRLEFEAESLARLNHPGIARVYEWGVLEDGSGRPYLAMEYVKGETIEVWAAGRQPGYRERIGLIMALCEAVAHAHQHGVVHRDLSPRNILVDADGRPKVLDFGLACQVDRQQESEETKQGHVLGTLGFMSPEQLMGGGLAVDTRSDVYAIGLIAFELLTGRHPYVSDAEALGAVVRQQLEAPALRPSSIDRSLRGDAEAVLLKAIEREPARRYQTALEYAADLRRLLEDRPVSARRTRVVLRAAKFVRRHRIAVSAASITLLVAAALSAKMLSTLGREARAQAALVRAFDAVVTGVLSPLAPKIGTLDERKSLLLRIETDIEEMARQSGDNPAALQLLATYLVSLGDVQRDEGNYSKARGSFNRAVHTYKKLFGAGSDPVVGHQYSIAIVKLGDVELRLGNEEAADSLHREALALDERLYERNPGDIKVMSNLFWSYFRFHLRLFRTSEAEADAYLDRANHIATLMHRLAKDEWRTQEAVARASLQRALRCETNGRHVEAASHSRAAVRAAETLADMQPDDWLHQGLLTRAASVAIRHALAVNDLAEARDYRRRGATAAERMKEHIGQPELGGESTGVFQVSEEQLAQAELVHQRSRELLQPHARAVRSMLALGLINGPTARLLAGALQERLVTLVLSQESEQLQPAILELYRLGSDLKRLGTPQIYR